MVQNHVVGVWLTVNMYLFNIDKIAYLISTDCDTGAKQREYSEPSLVWAYPCVANKDIVCVVNKCIESRHPGLIQTNVGAQTAETDGGDLVLL